ncbi:MAG: GNAT family N-acetyltransferase [Isosphaeraceae bacterium]
MVTPRPYRPEDAPALLALFRDTVRRVNARDYTTEQVRAWAPDQIDQETWAGRFAGKTILVAEDAESGRPLGFADLEPDGHIDRFFVSADHQRRGVGASLLAALVAEARTAGLGRLSVEASVTARPFFEAQGFVVLAEQSVLVRDVKLVNFRMERDLNR